MTTYPRRTPAEPVRLTGYGLHSGNPVRVVIRPGSDGIAFHHGRSRTPAEPRLATNTTRGTQLGDIATVEHLMSAFACLGITDAEIELSYPELPALDGSAAEFVLGLDQAGTHHLGSARLRLPPKPIHLRSQDASIRIRPGSGQWSYTFHWKRQPPQSQTIRCHLPDDYRGAVAPARTIAIAGQIPTLLAQGIGRGLDEQSVVILGTHGYHNTPRYPDEPARHKLLDLVGDLYLAGVPVHLLDVTAHHSGHTMATHAARRLAVAVASQDRSRSCWC
ncbi:UDP-3-O-[3-hydroxymyristoyl] N-acetylglucosamine deacetylase [Amycolatopsis arida]|uniref:UDP-3-O-acyl-N-acetylglucosamine deacetylase n=1 Tax=Amycolatopsis arida TaxID=587909 RepID=A0A1I5L9U8_9PSEU|nr:UDP-3-O-acyl-N-acetylglucosamine deacetylase [Amycolatopsis arida]TDX93640.1 UDP-3-O-[3-hydroxymyristoyl] N-acetylglucosamine deacetylase [Amycolatopsis arida]SFO93983.1 UDP-3-O-[3-hydroxymyristoyl] N-acetylglucosamine deacetylase [Amycolatopsis arida]